MELKVLSREDCEQVRLWRNQSMESLRTPYELTREAQEDFYEGFVSMGGGSQHKYWGIHEQIRGGNKDYPPTVILIGIGGITNVQWENRIGEISLLIAPECRDKGYGKEAVELLLDKAFNYLNLKTVYGETYSCSPAWGFWKHLANEGKNERGCWVILPNRKYWEGHFHNSAYFSFDRVDYATK